MRRDKGKGQGWKNIVPIGMGGFLSGPSNVAKHSMTKGEAKRAKRESSSYLFLLLAFVIVVIGLPLIIGWLAQ